MILSNLSTFDAVSTLMNANFEKYIYATIHSIKYIPSIFQMNLYGSFGSRYVYHSFETRSIVRLSVWKFNFYLSVQYFKR